MNPGRNGGLPMRLPLRPFDLRGPGIDPSSRPITRVEGIPRVEVAPPYVEGRRGSTRIRTGSFSLIICLTLLLFETF